MCTVLFSFAYTEEEIYRIKHIESIKYVEFKSLWKSVKWVELLKMSSGSAAKICCETDYYKDA